MHAAALGYIATHLGGKPGLSVLEFGSRDINGSPRNVIEAPARYVGVDVTGGPGVDVVADAATVIVAPPSFDAVVCAEVFEHADDDTCRAIVANAANHLAIGGLFLATMAGPGRAEHSAVDGGRLRPDEFYRNVTPALLLEWLVAAGLSGCVIDEHNDDLRCVATKGEAS